VKQALETPFWALRADHTYLFASHAKWSCKSFTCQSNYHFETWCGV